MPAHNPHSFLEARFREQFAVAQMPLRVQENPRVVKRAPANAHTGAARLIDHELCCLGRGHVAVADDGDAFDRTHHGANTGKVNGAAETLLASATVNKD